MLNSQTPATTEHTEITLASDFDMQMLQFPAGSKNLLIWLPSRHGVRAGHSTFAASIRSAGIDFWLVDLHTSYMVLTGRKDYARFKPQHIKELIDYAVQQGWKNIFVGGESRGAALAMQGVRQWQVDHPGKSSVKGLLFYHPHLIVGYTEIGERAAYHPITNATNIPMYIFQPQYSTKNLRSAELVEQMQRGGATVFFHLLKGVQGGFHVRSEGRLKQRDLEERNLIGQRIKKAMSLLARLPTPVQAAQMPESEPHKGAETERYVELIPLDFGEVLPLRLYDQQDRLFDLKNHRGEVVLVNFWATWCGPCVKEIGSLMRLIEHLKDKPFRVVAVNIGESKARVEAFFKKLKVTPNFVVLFDPDGKVARDWKIYAYPSNYLLNKQHKVRFGYRGALRWDQPHIVKTVETLIE